MKKKNQKKKQSKKAKRQPTKTTELVIKVQSVPAITEKDLLPQQQAGKYRVVSSWLSEKQILWVIQKTPKHLILKRKGRGGQMFDYVPGWYFKKALNYAFGWNWDFKIVKQEIIGKIGDDGTQVVTTGQLTVKDDKGHQITKEDNGKSDIKYLKGTKTPMDIGNDFKGSATDALKRCAVQLGIASDVYGGNESKEEGYSVQTENLLPAPKEEKKDDFTGWVDCQNNCGALVSPAAAEYQKKHRASKILCKDCAYAKKK